MFYLPTNMDCNCVSSITLTNSMSMDKSDRPHALLIPFPAQGHINPFMQLAHILIQNNVMVTFVNTDVNHGKLAHLRSTRDIRFLSFPDGLPEDHPRVHKLPELADSLIKKGAPHIEKIVVDTLSPTENGNPCISIIIADGIMNFTKDVADKHGIPRITFWTTSACGFAAYNALPTLKQLGIVPAPEDKDLFEEWKSKLVGCIPAMETLRAQDLPSFFRTTDETDFMLEWCNSEIRNTHTSELVLLNTWDDLERPVLEELIKDFNGKVLSIGPLMLFAQNMQVTSSLWEEESSCLSWLDDRSPKSVVYVGFGSIALLSDEQVAEFAWGLESCGQPFLWVIRPDLVSGSSSLLPQDFMERCGDRACFVSWAPQKQVLDHPSVACFLTHSGWNSTLESLCAGVPMLCWPYFAEQQTNRRFVSTVWNVGLELSERIQREEIVEGVKKIMLGYQDFNENMKVENGGFMVKNALKYRDDAFRSVPEGGSSYVNLHMLIDRVVRSSPNA